MNSQQVPIPRLDNMFFRIVSVKGAEFCKVGAVGNGIRDGLSFCSSPFGARRGEAIEEVFRLFIAKANYWLCYAKLASGIGDRTRRVLRSNSVIMRMTPSREIRMSEPKRAKYSRLRRLNVSIATLWVKSRTMVYLQEAQTPTGSPFRRCRREAHTRTISQ